MPSSLIRRLIHAEEPTINVHLFTAITAQVARTPAGTAQDAVTKILAAGDDDLSEQFTMSSEELSHWNWLITQARAGNVPREKFADVIMVGEAGVYNEQDVIDELGLPL